MHSSRTISLGLALTGLCALGVTAARPAAAQNLLYTLSGVKFADGATASGSFSYNFTTATFGTFDVTTTSGLTDGLLGTHYLPPTGTAAATSNFLFQFSSGRSTLYLNTNGPDNVPGVITLFPGSFFMGTGLTASGEFAPPVTGGLPVTRLISAGSLIATPAVPEAPTTVSFGLLLVLGMGGLVIAARRKKAAAPSL